MDDEMDETMESLRVAEGHGSNAAHLRQVQFEVMMGAALQFIGMGSPKKLRAKLEDAAGTFVLCLADFVRAGGRVVFVDPEKNNGPD